MLVAEHCDRIILTLKDGAFDVPYSKFHPYAIIGRTCVSARTYLVYIYIINFMFSLNHLHRHVSSVLTLKYVYHEVYKTHLALKNICHFPQERNFCQ